MADDVEDDKDEGLEAVDALEEAWVEQAFDVVAQLATERLQANVDDAHAHAWLGLALSLAERLPAGQPALTRAFELLRAQEARASSEDEKLALHWDLHGIANRLVDSLVDVPELAVEAAHFVVDTLKHDHAPSLRLLAEDMAVRQGDPIRGLGFLKRALAIDALDPETHYLAARLFARIGKKPQVLSHLSKALDNAAGTISVRSLSRFETDFDGFRADAEFLALTDLFPTDPALRPIYEALDRGELQVVVDACEALSDDAAPSLDVLYPWREATELLLDAPEAEEEALSARLDQLQADIEELEEQEAPSPAWSRYCGDA